MVRFWSGRVRGASASSRRTSSRLSSLESPALAKRSIPSLELMSSTFISSSNQINESPSKNKLPQSTERGQESRKSFCPPIDGSKTNYFCHPFSTDGVTAGPYPGPPMSIVLEDLTKRYGGHPVVSSVSLEVGDGELFVLLGSSGSGKSTLLRMIAGLSEVDAGRVTLHGRDVTDLPPAGRGVGFVFQSYALFRGMSVAENVEFALAVRGVAAAARRRRRDELLELVGLSGLGGRMPRQLSGGQQQRVALARALAHQPEVLLLDEPFGALDAKVRLELRRTIREIQRELGDHHRLRHPRPGGGLRARRPAGRAQLRPPARGGAAGRALPAPRDRAGRHLPRHRQPDGGGGDGGRECGWGRSQFPLATRAEPVRRRAAGAGALPAGGRRAARPRPTIRPSRSSGEAVVEQRSFVGSFERLRLRLPPLPGVRAIAPAVPFGRDEVWIEATRSQDQARRFPLRPGDAAWVGVQRVHALVHPGLRFLLLTDGSARSRGALALAGEIARRAHARVAVLGPATAGDAGERALQEAREVLGGGLAALETRLTPEPPAGGGRRGGLPPSLRPGDPRRCPRATPSRLAEGVLAAGQHHLLLAPRRPPRRPLPARLLICVAVGEPGKEDVSFSGRLARHLGAEVTILTVLPAAARGTQAETLAERFLAGSARTLNRLGVPVATRVRHGAVREEIARPDRRGRARPAGARRAAARARRADRARRLRRQAAPRGRPPAGADRPLAGGGVLTSLHFRRNPMKKAPALPLVLALLAAGPPASGPRHQAAQRLLRSRPASSTRTSTAPSPRPGRRRPARTSPSSSRTAAPASRPAR